MIGYANVCQSMITPKYVLFLLVLIPSPLPANESLTYAAASELWETGKTVEAVDMFERLVEKGDLNAAFSLGVIHENGFGVPRKGHMIKAVELFRMAAERGHSEAQNRMGGFYYSGSWSGNVEQDLKKAMKWYRIAAEQGHRKSQFRLGNLLCWFGQTVEGYAWLTVAFERGDASAKPERQRICKGMTPKMNSRASKLKQQILTTYQPE